MPDKPNIPPPPDWRSNVIKYIADHPDRPLKARSLGREVAIPDDAYARFRALLREMLSDGALTHGPGRTLALAERPGTFTGTFRANLRGFGFIEVADRPDVYVPRTRTASALDGDTVRARLIKPRRRGETRAEIIRVLARAEVNWVGVLERRGSRWVVQPRGRVPAPLVTIADPSAKSARPGDMVVVEPVDHRIRDHTMAGVIIERLGDPSTAETIIRAVARRCGLPQRFDAKTRAAAKAALRRLDKSARKDREDLRDLLTITIDPADARDFDDAFSIERDAKGNLELGVHIADVAHFVQPDTPLDREARKRGNSTYFPGHVVPMLPESLSNGVCSLQPNQPRLARSVFITYDQRGKVVGTQFANSVIHSDLRLTYEQATRALEGDVGGIAPEIVALLKTAERLARRIRKRRLRDGMLVLTLPEVRIKLDKHHEVVDAGPADTSFSHTLIEMFMVEANEAVCRLFAQLDLPHLRRIHPPPEPEPAARLATMLSALGLHAPKALDQRTIQQLLERVSGAPEAPAVNLLLLRAMTQACYSPELIGHFALASKHYCHFTSPIRRYPDLVIHRLLDRYIRGELDHANAALDVPDGVELAEIGRLTSATERRSQQAERDATQWLLLELMKGKLGECFAGTITGLASIGAFVQIEPFLAEGLVPVADFGRDVWKLDESRARFVGQYNGRIVGIGQRCRVVIAAVDEFRQQMHLVPESPDSFGTRQRRKPRPVARKPRRSGQGRLQRGRKRR